MPLGLKEGLKKAFPGVYARWLDRRQHPWRARIGRLLAAAGPARCLDSEESFSTLQNRFPAYPDYGYDEDACYRRGTERCLALIGYAPRLQTPGAAALEIGCADGMVGVALAARGHAVTLVDIEDRRDLRARGLEFLEADVCAGIKLENEVFDVVYSYNALEHVADPARAVKESVRLCKPGGYLYFEFGPLFASAWGLHAYGTLRMPYAQFLFSPRFLEEKFRLLGVEDLGRKREALQPLNGWRPVQFARLWRESGCRVEFIRQYDELRYLDIIEEFPGAFAGRGLTYEDVTRQSLFVLLRKP